MGFISNTICGYYNTRKTIRSSSLSLLTKHRSSLSYHCHCSLSSSSTINMQQFQSAKITIPSNLNTESTDENACNDERLPVQSYRHSTFRPYPISQEDENSFRPSRSHESLLAYSSATHTIDLDGAEAQIHSIHPSAVDVSNYFELQNTYYSCRNSRERNRWIEKLVFF
ncbi:unnamed protein product [Brugia timori]|uniref:PH domain-containing protein n=1 Tax=Brugia timori TaxID=42155 RepID=A0A0R3R622_9BILA|nr:unnamed protein product [Brugia timori]